MILLTPLEAWTQELLSAMPALDEQLLVDIRHVLMSAYTAISYEQQRRNPPPAAYLAQDARDTLTHVRWLLSHPGMDDATRWHLAEALSKAASEGAVR